ncbi:MAG: sodium-translocating pyrophosphatase [Euryarchaeota archaeon]|nr:sodium-translocating pyrophosphatase [Euryarchaeota archaeon]
MADLTPYALELSLAAAGVALVYAIYLTMRILRQDEGSDKMKAIAQAIREGSMAYLARQYRTIAIIAVAVAVLLAVYPPLGPVAAGAFILGAVLSALAGYAGMLIAIRANVRTARAAERGVGPAMDLAFSGGTVTGMAIVGLGLFGIAGLYMVLRDVNLLIGFGFGASLISLFARVGGGIYTKVADVGADLVGKLEAGIPEDDARNPAVIADNVGDNVGDCAGMGADLFESYVVTLIAAMILGALTVGKTLNGFVVGDEVVLLPLIIAAGGIAGSILGSVFVRPKTEAKIWPSLNVGIYVAAGVSAILIYVATLGQPNGVQYFLAASVGILTTIIISHITAYYTSTDKPPVRELAELSNGGPTANVLFGLGIGFRSTILPILTISAAILISYQLAGIYGIALAAMGLLSVTGIIMSIDSYGPISDNAGGIAEMSGMSSDVRKVTDALDAVGNTTKATTKGVAIASASISALALFTAFTQEAKLGDVNLFAMPVLVGLIIGATVPLVFSAWAMQAVGRSANLMVEEVRRQFREIPGIMEGTAKPDYARCVDISTQAAIRQLGRLGAIAVIPPIVIGLLLGPLALAGFLVGSILTGQLLAYTLCNAGAAWDNGKKYIEQGNHGGKKSPAHQTAVIGDTIGDPAKDTAGPAINSLIKVINTVSLLLAPLLAGLTIAAYIPGWS